MVATDLVVIVRPESGSAQGERPGVPERSRGGVVAALPGAAEGFGYTSEGALHGAQAGARNPPAHALTWGEYGPPAVVKCPSPA
jgi:hypothetical protein